MGIIFSRRSTDGLSCNLPDDDYYEIENTYLTNQNSLLNVFPSKQTSAIKKTNEYKSSADEILDIRNKLNENEKQIIALKEKISGLEDAIKYISDYKRKKIKHKTTDNKTTDNKTTDNKTTDNKTADNSHIESPKIIKQIKTVEIKYAELQTTHGAELQTTQNIKSSLTPLEKQELENQQTEQDGDYIPILGPDGNNIDPMFWKPKDVPMQLERQEYKCENGEIWFNLPYISSNTDDNTPIKHLTKTNPFPIKYDQNKILIQDDNIKTDENEQHIVDAIQEEHKLFRIRLNNYFLQLERNYIYEGDINLNMSIKFPMCEKYHNIFHNLRFSLVIGGNYSLDLRNLDLIFSKTDMGEVRINTIIEKIKHNQQLCVSSFHLLDINRISNDGEIRGNELNDKIIKNINIAYQSIIHKYFEYQQFTNTNLVIDFYKNCIWLANTILILDIGLDLEMYFLMMIYRDVNLYKNE
mgnify:CR=1 FL=1